MTYFLLFLQSNVLEIPVYYLLLRRFGQSASRTILFVTAMNSLTHPIVFFWIMGFHLTYLQNILIAETFAVVIEAGMLIWLFDVIRPKLRFQCMIFSVLANLTSWQLAPVLTYLISR